MTDSALITTKRSTLDYDLDDSTYDELVDRYTDAELQRIEDSHDTHYDTLDTVEQVLDGYGVDYDVVPHTLTSPDMFEAGTRTSAMSPSTPSRTAAGRNGRRAVDSLSRPVPAPPAGTGTWVDARTRLIEMRRNSGTRPGHRWTTATRIRGRRAPDGTFRDTAGPA